MRVHFIAIGGSAMHNLAIAMKQNGAVVTGSDDEVFEPSRSRLAAHGLLPDMEGWDARRVTPELDAVILGMHARKDNPELLRALEIGVKVYSYPEYLYEQCKNKKRIVIGGSHGKTTVTSMVMHALKANNVDFDYMVGAQLEGFDTMVRISDSARIVVFEGDEYLSSPIDLRPKFLWYRPHIALLTGVAWDHINVFPDIDIYNKQFELFIASVEQGGYLTWFEGDATLQALSLKCRGDVVCEPYDALESSLKSNSLVINYEGQEYPIPVFGSHNLQNMAGALNVCLQLDISAPDFLIAMKTFKGASRRLQVLAETESGAFFYDFAHAPSKLKATVQAVKERYPDRLLVACIELHTFSSLNIRYLEEYHNTMQFADRAIVFYSPEVVRHKKLPEITLEQVAAAFNIPISDVLIDRDLLQKTLMGTQLNNLNLLVMTSGNFGGMDIHGLASSLTNRIA